MSFTYNEKLEYELNKLRGNREAQNNFFGKALGIQNSPNTYDIKYAEKKFDFACDVLVHCDYCNHTQCEQCKLLMANKNAKEDILEGRRKRPEKKFYTPRQTEDYIVRFRVDKKTGIVTAIMRCNSERDSRTV